MRGHHRIHQQPHVLVSCKHGQSHPTGSPCHSSYQFILLLEAVERPASQLDPASKFRCCALGRLGQCSYARLTSALSKRQDSLLRIFRCELIVELKPRDQPRWGRTGRSVRSLRRLVDDDLETTRRVTSSLPLSAVGRDIRCAMLGTIKALVHV